MPVIDHLFANARIRRLVWQLWYPFLTRRISREGTVFLNYGYEEEPPMRVPLETRDEPDRACIQLYHHVAAQVPLAGKKVLEVSCGHGGGASYLARTFKPQAYTGLDLNADGIHFCRRQHQVPGLNFVQGDAENLPFKPGTFDAVINVEASHCYPHFPRFLTEAARVLRPGGHLLYADFRFRDRLAEWKKALAGAPFQLQNVREINSEVIRGMNRNSARSQALVERYLPRFLRGAGQDFAGTKGSRLHDGLLSGEVSYRSYCFAKKN
jgi:ubiquinone/menaquinone biosynthesis C-methylase UbiE